MNDGPGVERPSPAVEERPLAGRRILVTRPREQSSELTRLLEGLGAEVLQIPAIRIEASRDPDVLLRAVADAEGFDWIVLTSVNGVDRFKEVLDAATRELGRPITLPALCAIGPATADAMRAHFGRVDLIADVHTAEGVVEKLQATDEIGGRRFLLPQAAGAREVLARSLRDRGGEVVAVEAYRTVVDASSTERLRSELENGNVDMVTFASASSVRGILELSGGALHDAAVATIGPITSDAARSEGLRVDVEADPHSVPGLVDGIVRFYTKAVSPRR